jgi:hypothetical protein
MINASNLSHAWIRTNTKSGFEKTGITAAVILCFATQPESRVTLWHVKGPDGFDFMAPSTPIEKPGGELQKIACLYGGVADEMVKLASQAQETLKKALKPDYGKLYRVAAGKAEEYTKPAA